MLPSSGMKPFSILPPVPAPILRACSRLAFSRAIWSSEGTMSPPSSPVALWSMDLMSSAADLLERCPRTSDGTAASSSGSSAFTALGARGSPFILTVTSCSSCLRLFAGASLPGAPAPGAFAGFVPGAQAKLRAFFDSSFRSSAE